VAPQMPEAMTLIRMKFFNDIVFLTFAIDQSGSKPQTIRDAVSAPQRYRRTSAR
jgi:hypothetical protein